MALLLECVSWGEHPEEGEVFLYTLRNDIGAVVKIATLGCAVTSFALPGPDGALRDVICGYDTLAAAASGKQNFGTVVGRCANRVAGGQFSLDGTAVQLPCNNGPNNLHGGPGGFFSRNFRCAGAVVTAEAVTLRLARRSADGEESYPGAVDVEVEYTLERRASELTMAFKASGATAPTLVSLTNHCSGTCSVTLRAAWRRTRCTCPGALCSRRRTSRLP